MTVAPGQESRSEDSMSPRGSPRTTSYKIRDPRWLQVNVCHEFAAGGCPRNENVCHYAHPPSNCLKENGKVTACFDAMKGRCQRETCKYFHPPEQIKDHLEALGRSYQQQRLVNWQRQHSAPACSNLLGMEGHIPGLPTQGQWVTRLCSADHLPMEPLSPRSPTLPRRLDKSDKLEICSEFMKNSCQYEEKVCPFAHPPPAIPPDSDGYITVCMDFMKGECLRVTCRYFHPPPHLQARVRAVQRKPSQLTGSMPAAQNTVIPQQQLIFVSPIPFTGQHLPIAQPPPLPPLVPASRELLIPMSSYPDSRMMPVPMPPMQPCFWSPGEPAVMMPYTRELQPVPGHVIGQCFEIMTPPATP